MSTTNGDGLATLFENGGVSDVARPTLDLLPMIVYLMNSLGEVTYVNQAAIAYFGDIDLFDAGWALATHPDDLAAAVSARESWISNEIDSAVELRMRRHDGLYRSFLTSVWVARDSAGTLVGWFGVLTDIDGPATQS